MVPPRTAIYTLSLHDALPICKRDAGHCGRQVHRRRTGGGESAVGVERGGRRSEEHTSELQSRGHLVCRLLLEKKKIDGAALADGDAAVVEQVGEDVEDSSMGF